MALAGCRIEVKREWGVDDRNSNGGMRDKKVLTRAGFAHFDRRNV